MPIVVLRRLDQPLGILPPTDGRGGPDELRVLARPSAGQLRKFKDADLLYVVDLPRGYELRPGDWRPLIDDRPVLETLMLEIVFQNVALFRFEPISTALLRQIESTLRQALSDLSRVFDLSDVHCEHPTYELGDRLRVTINGAHKNGSHVNIVIPIHSTD